MRTIIKSWLSSSVILSLILLSTVLACAQEPQGEPELLSVQGELISVNPDLQLLVIRTAENVEVEFHFSEETEVAGSDETVAGLATMSGSQVTVHYRAEGEDLKAVKIEVAS